MVLEVDAKEILKVSEVFFQKGMVCEISISIKDKSRSHLFKIRHAQH